MSEFIWLEVTEKNIPGKLHPILLEIDNILHVVGYHKGKNKAEGKGYRWYAFHPFEEEKDYLITQGEVTAIALIPERNE